MPRTKYNAQCYHLNTWRQGKDTDCYQWFRVGKEDGLGDEGYLVPVDGLLITSTIPANACELGKYSRLDLLPAGNKNKKKAAKNRGISIDLDGEYHILYRQWDRLLIVPSDHPDVFDTPHWEDDYVRGGEGISPKADIRERQRNQRKMKEWFGDDWQER